MATIITKNSSTASSVPAAGSLQQGELAVNVTDKKLYTKDSSAAVVKLVGSLGNQEANAVAITGGTINGTAIGGTTPAAAAFTTASASGGFTGNLTGNASTVTNGVYTTGSYADPAWITSLAGSKITGNISGNAANVTGTVAIANGGTGLTALGTGVQTALGQTVTGSGGIVLAASPSLTTPNLGTPSAVTLTNATGLPVSTGISGLGTNVATALGVSVGSVGSVVVNGGALGTPSSGTLTNATGLPLSTGVTGTLAVANGGTGITAFGSGVATALGVNVGSAGAFVVNGGALGTPSSGTVTNLTGTASININGTVGATTPNTGSFTTLTTSSTVTINGGTANGVAYLNGSKVLTTGSALTFDGTNLGVGALNTNALLTLNGDKTALRVERGSAVGFAYNTGTSATDSFRIQSNAGPVDIYTASGQPITFSAGASEQMRLTSTGLGIGTSSPGAKLDVIGNAQASNLYLNVTAGTLGMADNSASILAYNATGGGGFTNTLRFLTNGAERMRLDSSGNLGLGVTPSRLIDAQKDQNSATQFRIRNDNTGTASQSSVSASYGDFAQYITMGQYSPSFTTSGLRAANSSGVFTSGNTNGLRVYTIDSTPLIFGTADTERARIDSSGNFLIGTTGASGWATAGRGLLEVNGSSTALIGLKTGGTQRGYLYSQGTDIILNADTGVVNIQTGTSQAILFSTNVTERARITSGGQVLFGTTTENLSRWGRALFNYPCGTSNSVIGLQNSTARAANNLYGIVFADNTDESNAAVYVRQTGTNNGADLLFGTNAGTGGAGLGAVTERARITSGGDFLVGTTTTSANAAAHIYKTAANPNDRVLYLTNNGTPGSTTPAGMIINYPNAASGNGSTYIECADSNSTRFLVLGSGNVQNANNSYGAISDIKLKENITDATPKLSGLNQLRVVNYNLKGDDLKQIGLVAQEVEQVFPGLVETSADRDAEGNDLGTTTKSVKYSVLVPMLLKAVQELTAMNDDLRARVAQLEAK